VGIYLSPAGRHSVSFFDGNECPNARLLTTFNSVLRPNTPHLVFSPTVCVTIGGHMYCCTTMRNTAIGIFHHTASNTSYTNANHWVLMGVLRRIMGCWYGVLDGDEVPEHIEGYSIDAMCKLRFLPRRLLETNFSQIMFPTWAHQLASLTSCPWQPYWSSGAFFARTSTSRMRMD